MAGIYVHIPFCHSKCSYCDFFSTPKRDSMEEYVGALLGELNLRRDEIKDEITTVYIGGGTPSILPGELLARLVGGIARHVDTGSLAEFTVEANPEDITEEWLDTASRLGVNRVSMGVQSFDDTELRAINRRHDSSTASRAIGMIKDVFPNFSCDLIYGLPGQTVESWQRSLERLMEFDPPHVSAYLLSYEPGTRLYAMLQAGKVREASDDTAIAMYDILTSTLRDRGYNHYEISNFAKPGKEAVHNSAYWNSVPYLGIGVSAHSFDGEKRSYNPVNIREYVNTIRSGKKYAVTEEETVEERFNDYLITRLRTSRGIDIDDMYNRWDKALVDRMFSDAQPHLASGRLLSLDGRLYIPESSLLTADSVLRDLLAV